MTRAVLVFDDGPGAGMGHRRRLWALGEALAAFGCRAELESSEAHRVEGELVVVDSYRYRADEPGRFSSKVLAAVDDLGRNLACDVVVDPNPGALAGTHEAALRALIGPQYALVDPSLVRLPARPVEEAVETVLVASGGHDPAQVGQNIASTLAELLPDVEVRLAMGPWAETVPPAGVVAVQTQDGLELALAEADVVITGAGVTLLEALTLGRPTVAVVLADNQLNAARGVQESGSAVWATVEDAPGIAAALALDVSHRRSLSSAARAAVDGEGALRVARALLELAR